MSKRMSFEAFSVLMASLAFMGAGFGEDDGPRRITHIPSMGAGEQAKRRKMVRRMDHRTRKQWLKRRKRGAV